MKNLAIRFMVGSIVFVAGVVTLWSIDRRLAIGVFLVVWGQNVINTGGNN